MSATVRGADRDTGHAAVGRRALAAPPPRPRRPSRPAIPPPRRDHARARPAWRRPRPRGPRRRARRPSPTSAHAATPPSATRTTRVGGGRPDGRLVLDASRAPRRARPPRPAPSAARSTRRSTTSGASPRPSGRHRRRTTIAPGIEIERRWTPLARVGAYVPGGSAPYPSSLVMTVVPARSRASAQVVVASPADRDGVANPVLLGAAGLLEVDAFIVAGGAQAIGALAYGLPDAGLEPGRPDRRSGQRLGDRGQDRGLRRGRDRPAGRARPRAWSSPRRRPTRDRVAADLITQAEHGPDSPAILVTTDAGVRRRRRGRRQRPARRAAAPRHPRPRRSRDHGRIVLAPTSMPRSSSSTPTPPSTCRSTSSRSSRRSRALRNAGSLFVGPWAPESAGDYATGANHVLPTGGLARGVGRPVGRDATASSSRSSASTATGLAAHPRDRSRPWPRPRACSPIATPSSIRFEDARPDEPDARHVQLADGARVATAGRRPTRRSRRATALDPRAIVRFDLNTSPDPAGARRPAAGGRAVRGAAVRVPADRLPPPRRGRRRPLRRDPGRDPRRSRRRRDPRHRGQGVPARRAARAVVPIADLRDVPRRHRAARGDGRRGPAPRRGGRLGHWTSRRPRGGRRATPPSSGCAARTTRPPWPSRTARSTTLLGGPRRGRRRRPAAEPPIVVLDEAYAEFVGPLAARAARRLPEPHRRPDREQGLRAGRPAGRVRDRPSRAHRPAEPVPAAGLGLDGVGHARHRGPAATRRSSTANLARVVSERDRLRDALARDRLVGRPVGHELPARRLRLGRARRRPSPRACCDAASCRARSRPAIRSPTTCA